VVQVERVQRGVLKNPAEQFGVGVSTVQRISVEASGPFAGAGAAPALL
jgi:hypothetical protein